MKDGKRKRKRNNLTYAQLNISCWSFSTHMSIDIPRIMEYSNIDEWIHRTMCWVGECHTCDSISLKDFQEKSYLQSMVLCVCLHTRTNHSIADGQNRIRRIFLSLE
jgi:hypothetical protein